MKIESIEFDKSVYLTSATRTIVPFLTTCPFGDYSILRFMIDHFCCLRFLVDHLPLFASLLLAIFLMLPHHILCFYFLLQAYMYIQ